LLLLTASALRLVEWLALAELFLSGGDQAKIMLSMLVVIFSRNWISRGLGVASKLDVFLGDMIGRAPDFHLRTIGFINPRQRIMTFAVASSHALVLTVSHGFLLADLSMMTAQAAGWLTRFQLFQTKFARTR
jgi:hypothetical protein